MWNNITYQLYGKTEIPVKKPEMVSTVPFGKFKKMWAVVWGDQFLYLRLVSPAVLITICTKSFSSEVIINR